MNLHIFKDIMISKYEKRARFIGLCQEAAAAAASNKVIFSLFILSAFISSYFVLQMVNGLSVLRFLLASEIFLLLFLTASVLLAVGLASKMKAHVRNIIKDAWSIFIPLNILIIYSLNNSKGMLIVVLSAIILSYIAGAIWYFIKILPGKQPDLDLMYSFPADEVLDVIPAGSYGYDKIRINGETRNAFCITPGEQLRLKPSKKGKKIKFAVSVNEESYNSSEGTYIIDLYCSQNGKEKRHLYSKAINPAKKFEDRYWMDVEVDLPDGISGELVFECRKENLLNDKNASICIAEPRIFANNKKPKKILYIIVDGLRRDHLGCYGYKRNTTPNMDRVARDGVVFKNAFVQGEWTLPSFMSMMSSMYPSAHRVYHPRKYRSIDNHVTTLQKVLREAGFITCSYFTHKRLMPYFGFAKGFDSHIHAQCDKEHNIGTADNVTSKALDILQYYKDENLFLMLHFFDSHSPLSPFSPYADMYEKQYSRLPEENVRKRLMRDPEFCFDERDRDNLVARYDSEIYRTDLRLGIIIDYLKREAQYEDALIVLSADHGMVLGEHGSMDALNLFDENLKVPVIMKLPSWLNMMKGISVDNRFVEANIDIMPTALDITGLEKPSQCQGRSLLESIKDAGEKGKGFAISESLYNDVYSVSLRNEKHRYIYTTRFDISEFNNFKEDNVRERLFLVKGEEPEAETGINNQAVSEYRRIIKSHISRSLENKL